MNSILPSHAHLSPVPSSQGCHLKGLCCNDSTYITILTGFLASNSISPLSMLNITAKINNLKKKKPLSRQRHFFANNLWCLHLIQNTRWIPAMVCRLTGLGTVTSWLHLLWFSLPIFVCVTAQASVLALSLRPLHELVPPLRTLLPHILAWVTPSPPSSLCSSITISIRRIHYLI